MFNAMDLNGFTRQLEGSLTARANARGVKNTAGLDKLAGALAKIADSNDDGKLSEAEQTSFKAVMDQLGNQLFAKGGEGINFAQMASALEQKEQTIQKGFEQFATEVNGNDGGKYQPSPEYNQTISDLTNAVMACATHGEGGCGCK